MTTLTQHKVQEAYALLNRHSVYFYVKKVMVILFELLFYLIALGLVIAVFQIPTNIVIATTTINESTYLTSTIHNENLTEVLIGFRVFVFLFALFFLFIGLLFGYIRRKDNRIRKAALLLEAAQSPTPQQL